MPELSVIMATYNRRDLLARTLPRVLRQDLPCETFEVIVIVDGSTDGTQEFLATVGRDFPNLRVFTQSNRGQAAAINYGLREARGTYVLFTDDDIVCGQNLVRAHLAAHTDGDNHVVYGPVLISSDSTPGLATELARTYCDEFFANLTPEREHEGWGRCVAAANTSARREILASGLDENFRGGNDFDFEFGMRLWKSGVRFRYQPEAVTEQVYCKHADQVVNYARGVGADEVHLCRKHPDARPLSSIGRLGVMPPWRRAIARFAASFPFRIERVLRPISSLLHAIPAQWTRKAALRLFMYEAAFSIYRGASREAGGWRALEREFAKRLPILLYHNVGPKRPGGDPALTISPGDFERQIRWLVRHGYTSIRTSDWLAWLREAKPLPEKPVLLTFDDAYCDFAEFGLPVLERYGFTATVFLVTSEIGGSNTWDQANGIAAQELMSAEQIRYWAARGIEFAAHSHTHPDLTAITRDERACEFRRSRSEVETLVGAPVQSFAYPFGFINDEVCDDAREYFDLAFTCDTGVNDVTTDPLRLRRAPVVPKYGALDPLWQVTLGFNPLIAARTRFGLWRRRQWRRIAG